MRGGNPPPPLSCCGFSYPLSFSLRPISTDWFHSLGNLSCGGFQILGNDKCRSIYGDHSTDGTEEPSDRNLVFSSISGRLTDKEHGFQSATPLTVQSKGHVQPTHGHGGFLSPQRRQWKIQNNNKKKCPQPEINRVILYHFILLKKVVVFVQCKYCTPYNNITKVG